MLKIKKIIEWGLYLLIFLLPWQTRYIFRWGEMNGRWEYGDISIYITDILLGILLVLALIWLVKCPMSPPERPNGNQMFGRAGNVQCPIKYQGSNTKFQTNSKSEIQKTKQTRTSIFELRSSKIWLIIALFELTIFLSIFWSQDKSLAIYGWLKILAGIGLFWLVQNIKFDWRKIIYAIIFSGIGQSILGIYQFITQSTFASKWLGMAKHVASTPGTSVIEVLDQRWLRAYGSLSHPNVLAGFLVVCLLFVVWLTITTKTKGVGGGKGFKGDKIIILIGLLTIIPALFFTFSRGAWVALFASYWLLIVSLLTRRKKLFINWKMLNQVLVLVLILAAILSIMYHDLIITRISSVERLEIKSNIERLNAYNQARKILAVNFPLGIGINNYSLSLHNLLNPNLESWDYQPVHNVFVLVLSEVGVVGLILFVIIIGYMLMSNVKCQIKSQCQNSNFQCQIKNQEPIPRPRDKNQISSKSQYLNSELRSTNYDLRTIKTRTIIFKLILIAILITMLFDHYFWTLSFGIYLFWLVLGLNMKIESYEENNPY